MDLQERLIAMLKYEFSIHAIHRDSEGTLHPLPQSIYRYRNGS